MESAGDAGKSAGEAPAPKTVESSGSRKSVQRPGSLNGLVLFNRVLAGVVLVLLGVVVYSVASIRADVAAEGDRLKAGAGAQHVVAVAILKEGLPSVDVFLDKVSQRNVFLSVDAKSATSTVAVLTGKVADLKLLGVSIDSSVDQESMAIIRNKAESRTYFIKKGQLVGDTGYTLERVLADRAVLKQGKQEIELK
jgi:type II secretory pathway component PulC